MSLFRWVNDVRQDCRGIVRVEGTRADHRHGDPDHQEKSLYLPTTVTDLKYSVKPCSDYLQIHSGLQDCKKIGNFLFAHSNNPLLQVAADLQPSANEGHNANYFQSDAIS